MSKFFCNYVAVVDSGVGGLTILSQLRKKYPQCNFLYLADNAYCPYGTKSESEIFCRINAVIAWLAERKVEAVVLACNTASVFADGLRKEFDLPIYDVIRPTCRLVAETTVSKKVALLATDATVKSDVYRKNLFQLGIHTVSFACSSFVPYVEHGTTDTPDCERSVREALKNLPQANVDTVILGCTHFPLLRDKISPYVDKARIVQCVTDFVPLSDVRSSRRGRSVFLTTGSVDAIKNASSFYCKAPFVHLDI